MFAGKNGAAGLASRAAAVATALAIAGPGVGQTFVSVDFDDGNADVFQAGDLLSARGMHGTFYVISGKLGAAGYMTEEQVRTLEGAGHEIGGHTLGHFHLPLLDADEQKRQVCLDRANLAEAGLTVRAFAYPFGERDAAAVQAVEYCGYDTARVVGTSRAALPETVPPADPFQVRAPSSVAATTTLADMQRHVLETEAKGGGWMHLVFHHLCVAGDTCQTQVDTFVALLDWLGARAPLGTVVATPSEILPGSMKPLVEGPPPAPRHGNLLLNPSLESEAGAGNLAPKCWYRDSFGTNTATWTRTADAHGGGFAERVDVTAWTTGGNRLMPSLDLGACAPAGVPGRAYAVTGWYKSTAQPRWVFQYRNRRGAWKWWTQSPLLPPSADWVSSSWTTGPLPAEATGVSFGLSLYGVGSLTVDDFTMLEVDVTPPVVSLTAPVPGPVQGQVSLEAHASDDQEVVRVDFLADGQLIATASGMPAVAFWDANAAPEGRFALVARAHDAAGNHADSAAVQVVVDRTPPASSIRCGGAPCTAGWYAGTLAVSLAGDDGAGSGVASIRYTLDGSPPSGPGGIDYTGPLAISASSVLTFSAVDVAGNAEAPRSQWLRVDSVAPWDVAVTSPADGSSVTGRDVRIWAAAQDDVGLYRVRFYLDGKQLGTRVLTSYRWVWDTTAVAKGTHWLQVRAEDAAGNGTSSAPIAVTVY